MESISLARDALDPRLLPVDELADCAHAALIADGRTILSYGTAAGYTPLRELIAQWFGVHPFRVLLTNGWLHGLALLAGTRARGRGVAVEYPIHDRAERLLLASGANLVGVTMQPDGLGVDELQLHLNQFGRPALIYTIPTFHNPTGSTATLDNRRRLLELVANQVDRADVERSLIVENDSYALTRFEGEPVPALFDLSGRETVYGSSFSTLLGPGLRVGWWILPEAVAGELAEAASSTYITPVLPAQATVFEFLRRGALEPYLVRLRAELRARRDALVAALEKHCAGLTWSRPEGGFFVWLELPPMTDGRAVLERAQGVSAVAGTSFGWSSSTLRLSFAAAAPDELEAAVERLAAAL